MLKDTLSIEMSFVQALVDKGYLKPGPKWPGKPPAVAKDFREEVMQRARRGPVSEVAPDGGVLN